MRRHRALVTALVTALITLLLSLSFLTFEARADSLTYYVYPAARGTDWSTPRQLAWTTVINSLQSDHRFKNLHAISHINFDLNCAPSDVLPGGARIFTGQTSANNNEEMKKLFGGYGLSVMLVNYKGRWETRQEIEEDLPARFQTGMIAFFDFQIRPETCARVARYLAEYAERGYDKIYAGLPALPRKGEGAGCSAFGVSVLDVAGLLTPEWDQQWRRTLHIPTRLLGGPITGKIVPLPDLFFSFTSARWHQAPSENSYFLTFWDPERAYHWIQTAWQEPQSLTGLTYEPTQIDNARGLLIDATHLPTPTDPLWQIPRLQEGTSESTQP